MGLAQIQRDLLGGTTSMVELMSSYLARIDDCRNLNIYVEVFEEEAISQAKALDQKIKDNPDQLGKLFGCVASVKDVICYKDHQVTASSNMLKGFTSQFTATALQSGLDQDMIIIGRTNCDEFAMGSSNENSAYGPTLNGQDPTRVPGGSSGAAAVSVQMDTCLLAFGSDTGGSVRQPAAFCGVYGMKPTYGRISRYGLIAYASSFDQIGLLSKDLELISTALAVVEGYDPMDSTSLEIKDKPQTSDKYRFTYFAEALHHESISPEIRASLQSKIDQLRADGHEVTEVSFDLLNHLVPCYYVLTTAEASSNLNRYDGLRYGLQESQSKDLKELYIENRSKGFGLEVKRRIMMGTFVLSVGYFDAYFNKAQKVRRLISDRIQDIFQKHDFILIPTTPDVAWPIGENIDDPVSIYLSDVFTVLANICGLPAISAPKTSPNSMPHGLQLIGPRMSDKAMLAAAKLI
jgi:aspartyl-tRNA(Asn)/glutamyl-tRNA(Gln) amidotransferase subunit A